MKLFDEFWAEMTLHKIAGAKCPILKSPNTLLSTSCITQEDHKKPAKYYDYAKSKVLKLIGFLRNKELDMLKT